MYVCICNGITDTQIKKEIKAGAKTLEDLQQSLGVATCCGNCADCANKLINNTAPQVALTTIVSEHKLYTEMPALA